MLWLAGVESVRPIATFAIALLAIVPSTATKIVVEPHGLGFRIVRADNYSDSHEAVEIAISAITEIDTDGAPVGVKALPSHNVVAFDNVSVSSTGGASGGYREGIPVEEVSLSTSAMGGAATVSLSAVRYVEGGQITTLESSMVFEVDNETVRVDVSVNDWPFCTPFGRNGGRACWQEAQDILLEEEGALPAPPAPPPPHTLLIPRCEEETVATFRFICDPRLTVCNDLSSVKFYLGDADQPPGRAPNTATIGGGGSNSSAAKMLDEFVDTGVYEHNLTKAEVGGFLNVSSLTPGLDYVFWSVWEHSNGSAPESNSRNFDLSRRQYWQCPGTIIDRNFQVGTSLSVSFTVNGTAPLTALCDGTTSNTGAGDNQTLVEIVGNSTTDGLATEGPGRHRLLLDETNITSNGTFCSEDWDGEEAGWAWDADVVAFSLGETSRIRLVSSALLDGLWSPLREGFSTANKEGDITVVVDTFESQATYSTLLFFAKVEVTDETNAGDEGEVATWVAIVFCIFLLWLLGCCSFRIAKDDHAARTWPAAMARATGRSKGRPDEDIASSLGSEDSDSDGPAELNELQIFPMAVRAGDKSHDLSSPPPLLPAAAPIAGWTTPGSTRSKLNLETGPSTAREAFPAVEADTLPVQTLVPSSSRVPEAV